ncbi:MAG: ATP-binding protein [Pseudomonadaceae bacterium]|nr:ATP-binding protein [Pseudomonadaceae bacterium]
MPATEPTLIQPTPVRGYALVLHLLGCFIAVYAATYYASKIGITSNMVVALWPAAGITLWMAWRYGWISLLPIFLAFYGYGLLELDYNNLLASLGNTVAAWLAAGAIRNRLRAGSEHAAANLLWLVVAGGLIWSAVSTVIGATELAIVLGLRGADAWLLGARWFISDVAGVLLTAPLLFAISERRDFVLSSLLRSREPIIALALAGVLAFFTWWQLPLVSASAKMLLLSAPVILWVSMRRLTIPVYAALSIIGLSSLTLATQVLNFSNQTLLETQLFLITVLAGGHLLHATVDHQNSLIKTLNLRRENLERAVRERTVELEKAKTLAENADQSKSEFLANTSHEVRTPLNAILGMAEFLDETELSVDQRKQVRTILSSGRNLMSLLNDVIDLSKVEAGKLDIVPEPSHLPSLIEDLRSLWRPAASNKDLAFEIVVDADSELPEHLLLDELRTRQCLSNMISNAIKFTDSGTVTVRVSRVPGEDDEHAVLVFDVADTGIGISSEKLGRLFTPFEQADSSITRRFGGTGLGLAISRQLAELMGGGITVESQPGEGTTFSLTLRAKPIAPPAKKDDDTCGSHSDANALKGLRTLIVEDNHVNRLVVKGHLKALDMHFDEATNGRECLDYLAQASYDLILLDVHMPVMDGMETIKQIRASKEPWRDAPVIALTADAMSEDRKRLLAAGMSGYASKPIDRSALIQEMLRVRATSNQTQG